MPNPLRALVLVLFAALCASASGAKPAVFDDRALTEAIASAASDKRVLVIDFTAVWCGPCRKMDKTTWIDGSVKSWFAEHGVALQIDVDEDPEIARDYHVKAMPTMIAVVDGEVADRTVGYKTPEQLLEWLDGVRSGTGELELLRRKTLKDDGTKNNDVDARYEYAQRLLDAREYAEATTEFLWLWLNMEQYSAFSSAIRHSYVAADIESLADHFEPARIAFADIRDESERRIKSRKRRISDLVDWAALNKALGDGERTLDWYDANKDNDKSAKAMLRLRVWIGDLLVEHERWADLGSFYSNPVNEIRSGIDMLDMELPELDPDQAAQLREMSREMLLKSASRMHAACLAAQREHSATKIAELLLERENTAEARLALVEWALRVGVAGADHAAWLEEAREQGAECAELAARLEEAVRTPGG